MHQYMKAIGFPPLKKKDLEILMEDIIENPDVMTVTKDSEGNEFTEFIKYYGKNLGLIVRGTYDEEDEFEAEYCVPFFNGSHKTTDEEIEVEKHAEKESYAGVCDDPKLGLTLIFYINNVADYLTFHRDKKEKTKVRGAILSGLSTEGRILLPIEKKKVRSRASKNEQRNKLMAQAREGDEDAAQDLAFEDIDIYAMLAQRVQKEDIMTIVTTYFMPYGIESDQYGILGEILNIEETQNDITHEEIYLITVNCNELIFDVCINKKDLQGEPMVGRRLKANIWMQAQLNI